MSPTEDTPVEHWDSRVAAEILDFPSLPSPSPKMMVLDVKSILNERLRELQTKKKVEYAAREEEEEQQETQSLRLKKELEEAARAGIKERELSCMVQVGMKRATRVAYNRVLRWKKKTRKSNPETG